MSRLHVAPQGLYDPSQEHDSCGVGFVVDIKGRRSHRIVQQAHEVVITSSIAGRAAARRTPATAPALLLQLPHRFFQKAARDLGIDLPAPGEYGVGMVFLPRDAVQRAQVEDLFAHIVAEEGQRVLGWRSVPTDDAALAARRAAASRCSAKS